MDVEIVGSSEAKARPWRCDAAIVVLPFTDALQARRCASLMAKRAGAPGLILAVHDDAREGFIRIANRTFEGSTSPFFGYAAQDLFPGRHWLRHALACFERPAVHLVAFNDGKWHGALAGYGLVRSDWGRRVYGGPLFHPGYRRHYADVELSLIAEQQQALAYAADAVLVEVDWDKDSKAVDADDRVLFRTRARSGFDGKVHSADLRERFH